MSLSSDIAQYFEALQSSYGLPQLYSKDILTILSETADFQAYKAALDKVKPEERLLVLLRSLSSQKTTLSPRLIDAELVVTFPDSNSISARHTLHVVRQMITGAKEELLIAGYAITDAGGVLTQVAEAARRGVRIILVCSDWKDGSGKTCATLTTEKWPPNIPRPQIFEYQNDLQQTAGMHAKCLLVDRIEMLIGSANFTFPGLNTNFEMGVRMNGHVAESARAVFDQSLRTGRFTEVKWT